MTVEEVLEIVTWIEIATKVLCLLFGVAVACAITLPKLKAAIKQRKSAKTDEEKAKAQLAIKEAIEEFAEVAEDRYSALDKALKSIGESGAGIYKKDFVMAEVKTYCDDNSFDYDKQEISDKIDKYIDKTKRINIERTNS